MAQALAEEKLDERDVPNVVISAGTLGIEGRQPAATAVRALEEWNVELEGQRSQGVSPPLLEHADAIAVMEPKHERQLLERAPELEDKIVRLWEYADRRLDPPGIEDPVGDDLETFRACRDLIDECLDAWFDELLDAPS